MVYSSLRQSTAMLPYNDTHRNARVYGGGACYNRDYAGKVMGGGVHKDRGLIQASIIILYL